MTFKIHTNSVQNESSKLLNILKFSLVIIWWIMLSYELCIKFVIELNKFIQSVEYLIIMYWAKQISNSKNESSKYVVVEKRFLKTLLFGLLLVFISIYVF